MQGKNYLFQFTKFKCNNRNPIIQIQIQLLIRLISVKFSYVCMIVANIIVTQLRDEEYTLSHALMIAMKRANPLREKRTIQPL